MSHRSASQRCQLLTGRQVSNAASKASGSSGYLCPLRTPSRSAWDLRGGSENQHWAQSSPKGKDSHALIVIPMHELTFLLPTSGGCYQAGINVDTLPWALAQVWVGSVPKGQCPWNSDKVARRNCRDGEGCSSQQGLCSLVTFQDPWPPAVKLRGQRPQSVAFWAEEVINTLATSPGK